MNFSIVSDHEVENAKIQATVIKPTVFMSNLNDGAIPSSCVYYIDINSLSPTDLERVVRAKLEKVSFFYDAPRDASKAKYMAAFWPPNSSDSSAASAALKKRVVGAFEDFGLDPYGAGNRTVSFWKKLLLGHSWLVPALSLIAAASVLYCLTFPSFIRTIEDDQVMALVNLRDILAVVSVGCLLAITALLIMREIHTLSQELRRTDGLFLNKLMAILRCIILIAMVLWIASVFLCWYLGGFSDYGPALAVADNPVLNYFVVVGNYLKYLFVILPSRITGGIIVPLIEWTIVIVNALLFILICLNPPTSLVITTSNDTMGTYKVERIEVPALMTKAQKDKFISDKVKEARERAGASENVICWTKKGR